eukprot:876043_1
MAYSSLCVATFARNEMHRLKIMEYFAKRGKMDLKYLIPVTDALLENGQIMIHSGEYKLLAYPSPYQSSPDCKRPYHTWNCCYTRYSDSRMNWPAEIHGPLDNKEPKSRARGKHGHILPYTQSRNPLIQSEKECGNPLTITINDILNASDLGNANGPHDDTDAYLIHTLSSSNYVYVESTQKLYEMDSNMSLPEIKLLHDLFNNKLPKEYYGILVTDKFLTVSIELPSISNYSVFDQTQSYYSYFFPVTVVNGSTKSIISKVHAYEKLLSQSKSILSSNKKLRSRLQMKDAELKTKDTEINELNMKLEAMKHSEENNGQIDENEILTFRDEL